MIDITTNRAALARKVWFLAIILGATYWLGALARSGIELNGGLNDLTDIPYPIIIVWKCLATGCLVASAFLVANSPFLRQLALVLMVIWFADFILALGFLVPSGVVFVIAHMIAIHGFWTGIEFGKRQGPAAKALSITVILAGLGTAYWVLVLDGALIFAIFPLFSAIACAAATRTVMPLCLCSLGYGVFFLSDAVVVISTSSAGGSMPWGWLAWLTYFSGLTMIARSIQVAALKK